MKTKAIKLVKSILYARRNNHINEEQRAHENLVAFCDKNNLNFSNVLDGASKAIRATISGGMNSL